MTKYHVKLGSLSKLSVGPDGVQRPLCHSCKNSECGNPIELVQVSIFGVTEKMKLYRSGDNSLPVIRCEGYSSYAETFAEEDI